MESKTVEIQAKLIENTAAILLYLDNRENIVFCNEKTRNLTGLNNTDILGQNWLEVLFRDTGNSIKKAIFKAVMDDALVHRRIKDFQCHILDKSGKDRLISWSISPIVDGNNQVEASTLCGQDITEIKERGISIKNIDDSLKTIISSIKEYALYVTNLDGNITYFGMGCESMLGWEKKDIIFKHVSLLHNGSGQPSDLHLILKQTRLTGRYETETELVAKSKKIIPVILTVNQLLDPSGKVSGFIFIAKDMTERMKLEYQIFQSEKLAALGQLSAGMAHEINNPLFVISGRLEMLKQEDFVPRVRDSLNIIGAQTDRIRNFIDRILRFSRKTSTALEPIDLNEAIESVLPWIQYNKLPEAKVEIEKNFSLALRKIKGDLHQLQEVFLNLLINAYQSMPNGGKIKIITNNLDNLHAQIEITDSGVGISEYCLKNIFMPFFTTKKEGLGLGLSICHNIIKNHNGSIELKSQINQGSSFIIKLPFA